MNRFKFSTLILFVAALFCATSCDETTDDIGSGLAGNLDNFTIKADTFLVHSQTKMLGAVQARSAKANLGCIRDYDTGAAIRGSYSTQFFILDGNLFPDLDSIRSLSTSYADLGKPAHIPIDQVIADDTYFYIYPDQLIGDSLQPLHLKVYELLKPIPDGTVYKSDFDPIKEGYVDVNNPLQSMSFTMADQTVDSATVNSSGYTTFFKIPLNNEYTRDGKTYKNYGTYLMRRYYQSKQDKNDDAFSNFNKFNYKVCHGMYITVDNGEGAMATIAGTSMNVTFRYFDCDTVPERKGATTFYGTDEVLQTSFIETDNNALQQLASDNSCTYLKTPAGLYTEMSIPVDEIMYNHERDSLSKAKVTLQCMNSEGFNGNTYSAPQYLLMIPADSVQTFFNEKKLTNGRTAFLATYSSSTNSYTFDNFAGMVAYMNSLKKSGKAGENWNKVALVPVSVTVTSSSSSSGSGSTVSAIYHNMALSSVKLVGGANPLQQTKMSVVYTRMSE